MNKPLNLTEDDLILCKNIVDTILDDNDLLARFQTCLETNNYQLMTISTKLKSLKSQLKSQIRSRIIGDKNTNPKFIVDDGSFESACDIWLTQYYQSKNT